MSKIKVTYFDMNGGRGEPIRLVLHCMGQRLLKKYYAKGL